VAIRNELRNRFKTWAENKKSTLNQIYDNMSAKLEPLADDIKAALYSDNPSAKLHQLFKDHDVPGTFRQYWSAISYADRRELKKSYKEVWKSEEAKEIRKKLRKTAISLDIPRLYSYAANGEWEKIEEILGIKLRDDQKNFATVARIIARLKGLDSKYSDIVK
jgi:mRNA-degrading endonuclease YafQ of YafQ-DinJ toxin-antitoxin module